MPVTVNKLKSGTLTIDGVAYATQATNVRITPPDQPSGDEVAEVLSGDPLPEESGDSGWRLNITAIQDFDNVAGFVNMSWVDQGLEVPFTWAPMGASGPSFAGTVTVWPVELGGDVNRRLSTDASWKIAAKPARTEGV